MRVFRHFRRPDARDTVGSIDEPPASTHPTVVGDFGGEYHISWIVTSSLVTIPVTTTLYGKLSDIYEGHALGPSIAIFLLRSALSGLNGDLGLNGFISPMV